MKVRELKILNANCRDASRLLSDASERRLSPLERTGLRIHLLLCGSCRRFRDQLAAMRRALTTLEDHAAPVALPEEARARIRERLAAESNELP